MCFTSVRLENVSPWKLGKDEVAAVGHAEIVWKRGEISNQLSFVIPKPGVISRGFI